MFIYSLIGRVKMIDFTLIDFTIVFSRILKIHFCIDFLITELLALTHVRVSLMTH